MATVSQFVTPYRWSPSAFLRAHDAGAFSQRVELVEGEVWPVVIGDWHGETLTRVVRALPTEGATITMATLPSGESLPDPDCWVRREQVEPRGHLGSRLSLWRPDDVLLVVEVSDETVMADLTVKTRVYGSAGYATYWVVASDLVYVHTSPVPGGYAHREEYHPGDVVPVPYADAGIAVADLLR